MYLNKNKRKNGRIHLSIVEGFRENGKVKHRTLLKIGYLDVLQKEFDDPIAHFTCIAKKMTLQHKQDTLFSVEIDTNTFIDEGRNLYTVGYLPLKLIYNELDLFTLFKKVHRKSKMEYSLNDIFQLLVYSRILYPGSKKETYDNRNRFFHPFDTFSLEDVYSSLDIFTDLKQDIQQWIWKNTKDSYHRDTSTSFYDCTNYYFEIANNDVDVIDEDGNIIQKGYRKRGPEKNKRPDPIIEMGLLMDSHGIPLSYDLFPGNESEKLSLRPILQRTKADFGIQRTIVVADRGLNTSDNIYFLAGKNDTDTKNMDGYVYGQSVRGGNKEFKEWVLSEEAYVSDIIKKEETDEGIVFIHKSRTVSKEIKIQRDGKRKIKVQVCQKQMAYYSTKYARKQKRERALMIEKAKDLIKNPTKYTRATSYGAAAYVKDIKFDKATGEVIFDTTLYIDDKRIQEEEQYDGYYSIVTSEIELSDIEIRNIYRGLIRIEDTFKVSKSNLEARPTYVWTPAHIEAHFLTCFVSLVIIRLLEQRLGRKYSVEKIIHSLKEYQCIKIDKNINQFLYYDEIIKAIEESFSIPLKKKYRTQQEIRKLLKY